MSRDKSALHREARERSMEVLDLVADRMFDLLAAQGYPAEAAASITWDALLAHELVVTGQQINHPARSLVLVRNRWIYSRSHNIDEVVNATGLNKDYIASIIKKFRVDKRRREVQPCL